jgi:hypothetical protein
MVLNPPAVVMEGKFLTRATFRSMWGVLSLLPAPAEIYPDTRPGDTNQWTYGDFPYQHPCASFDLYDANAWELSLSEEETLRLQNILDTVKRLYRELYDHHLGLDQELRSRMAVLAGVGYESVFRLEIKPRLLLPGTRSAMTIYRIEGSPHREGDGRVPLASAELEYVGAVRYAHGKHDELPMIRDVYEDAFRWLSGNRMQLSPTPLGPLQDHLAVSRTGADAPDLSGIIQDPMPDSPGYLDFEAPSDESVAAFENRLQLGQLPEFGRVHIL